jgi:hypothetical protein
MGSRRIWRAAFAALVAAAALFLFYEFRLMPGKQHFGVAQGAAGGDAAPRAAAATGTAPDSPGERSHLADGLNSPDKDVHSDLRIINRIFIAYRGAVRDGDPVGENVEITAVLKGKNRLGFAFVPADCPALNAKGELCDRWGTPYFFHQISGEKMEIRSAGPDRRLWTADDEVLTP